MGKLLKKKYQTSANSTGTPIICSILMTQVFATAAGSEPAGTLPPNAMLVGLSRNSNSIGLSPRAWVGSLVSGTGTPRVVVPKLTEAAFNSKAENATFTVGSGTYTLKKRDESAYGTE